MPKLYMQLFRSTRSRIFAAVFITVLLAFGVLTPAHAAGDPIGTQTLQPYQYIHYSAKRYHSGSVPPAMNLSMVSSSSNGANCPGGLRMSIWDLSHGVNRGSSQYWQTGHPG